MSFYKTSDLYLSAFLRVKGIFLQNIEKENGKIVFVFQNKGEIESLVNAYINDNEVGVLSYKAALNDLRSIIFNYQGSALIKEN